MSAVPLQRSRSRSSRPAPLRAWKQKHPRESFRRLKPRLKTHRMALPSREETWLLSIGPDTSIAHDADGQTRSQGAHAHCEAWGLLRLRTGKRTEATIGFAAARLRVEVLVYALHGSCSQVRVARVSRVVGRIHFAIYDHRCDEAWGKRQVSRSAAL